MVNGSVSPEMAPSSHLSVMPSTAVSLGWNSHTSFSPASCTSTLSGSASACSPVRTPALPTHRYSVIIMGDLAARSAPSPALTTAAEMAWAEAARRGLLCSTSMSSATYALGSPPSPLARPPDKMTSRSVSVLIRVVCCSGQPTCAFSSNPASSDSSSDCSDQGASASADSTPRATHTLPHPVRARMMGAASPSARSAPLVSSGVRVSATDWPLAHPAGALAFLGNGNHHGSCLENSTGGPNGMALS
mmetsp:Transcript_12789/g.48995  ORF Transcript_12789/g.48995 Transcript_12789/m.48995 type:complete len:247 (-) Transcript_12789:267-1007(-)